jgi:hypothetical protein
MVANFWLEFLAANAYLELVSYVIVGSDEPR